MISFKQNSNRVVILLHEIYGVNAHMKDTAQQLFNLGFDVICPHLLARKEPFEYTEQEAAYQHFTTDIGFTNASNRVKSIIQDIQDRYQSVYLLGFSIGATIAWLCSEEQGVDGVIGFYSSRIRDHLTINPACPTLLFFPEKEQSFQVDELMQMFSSDFIQAYKLKGLHGFADPNTSAYNETSAEWAKNKMLQFLGVI